MDNRPPREGGSVWQIFTLEQLKVTLGIFALNRPPIGRSVAYRHCITGYCYSCVSYGITHRHKTAYRSKVATLAGQTPNIPHRQLSELFIRLPSLLCSPSKWLTITTCKAGVTLSIHPLQTVLGGRQTPKTRAKRNSSKTIAPLWKNPQDGVFKWGFV